MTTQPEAVAAFTAEYTRRLTAAIERNPHSYFYTAAQAPEMAEKMVAALARKNAALSPVIRATAKALGIPPTMGGIAWYLAGNGVMSERTTWHDPKRWKSGTVAIPLRDGTRQTVKARVIVGGFFAVHRPADGSERGWHITHIPTGRVVRGGDSAICRQDLAMYVAEKVADIKGARWHETDPQKAVTRAARTAVKPILDECHRWQVGVIESERRAAKVRKMRR